MPVDREAVISPWLVAAVFAPTALLLWAIGLGLIPLDAAGRRAAFGAIALLQLFLAVALYEQLLRHRGAAVHGGGGCAALGGMLAVGVFIVGVVSQFAAGQSTLASVGLVLSAAALLQQVVTIALAEELWFRGLWMRATADRPALAILGGAAGFGLYHLHQGPAVVATTAALGLLFALARWYGAPIWALALAHGAMNWVNGVLAPARGWRFDPAVSRTVAIGLVLAGAGAIYVIGSRVAQSVDTRRGAG